MRIGVFDSGIGGLTVLQALRRAWPGHAYLYLGDTARVPYGTKSGATVVRYARQNARLLLDEGIDLLVVACNTASAYALDTLRAELPVPVVGVIDPGASEAVATGARHIGVIGTSATVASGAYERAIARLDATVRVTTRACPLFVPLVEEGWETTPLARLAALQYLGDWVPRPDPEADERADADVPQTVVLGCTHYPLLKSTLSEVLGSGIRLVDSAEATARAVAPYVEHARPEPAPQTRLLVTDGAPGFARIAARMLEERTAGLEVVDLPPAAEPARVGDASSET